MRRADREVKELQSMEAILKECDVAVIALTDDQNWPYCVPVNFGYTLIGDTLTLYFHGAKQGKKAELLKKSPPVSVCIYRNLGLKRGEKACEFGVAYESVMAFGHACVLESEQERLEGLDAIMEKAGGAGLPYDQAVLSHTAVFAVRVERFTAKRRS